MTLSTYEGRDLPPIIQRAITRVNDPAILQDISPSLRWALSVLLRRVSAEHGQDLFWVKRSNFAGLIGVSEATVYRMLTTFEELGLITRVTQKRSTEGAFTVGEMRLSDAFCQLIGLTGTDKEDKESLYQYSSKSRLSPVRDVIEVNQGVKQFALQKHSLHESPKKSVGKSTTPPEFIPLLRQGLTSPQLFLLMRLAREAGKKLSDIVVVCHEPIEKLRGVELFAYLRTLTQADKDFGHIRQHAVEEKQQAEERIAQVERTASMKARYRGKWLRGPQDTLFQTDSIGRVAVYRTGQPGRCDFSGYLAGEGESKFWQRVEAGDFTLTEAPPLQSYMN